MTFTRRLSHAYPGRHSKTVSETGYISRQDSKAQLNINCLCMKARSIANKTDELQVLATNADLLAITETWLFMLFMVFHLVLGAGY